MIRRPPRSTQGVSSAASDVYKRQLSYNVNDSSIWRPFFQDPSAQRDDWCIGCSCVCNPGPSRISRPATLASIQDLHLRYDAPNIVHAEQIQVKLTEEIKVRPIICLSVSEYIKFCAEISPPMAYEFREPSLCKHFFQCWHISAFAKVRTSLVFSYWESVVIAYCQH